LTKVKRKRSPKRRMGGQIAVGAMAAGFGAGLGSGMSQVVQTGAKTGGRYTVAALRRALTLARRLRKVQAAGKMRKRQGPNIFEAMKVAQKVVDKSRALHGKKMPVSIVRRALNALRRAVKWSRG